jgi:tetratricopeptide (TPR) repeat protein
VFQRNWHPWLVGIALLLALLASVLGAGWFDLRQAEAAWKNADYSIASDAYARAARVLFWRNHLWEQAGISASLAGEHQRAVGYFQLNEPATEQGWFRLAASHYQLGDPTSALAAIERGLQFHDSLSLYDLQALIHYEQNEWAAERVSRENQIRLGSEDAYSHYRLGLLLALFSPKDALPVLTRASTLNPEVAPAVETLRAALALSSTQAGESQKMVSIGRGLGLVQEWDLALAAFTSAVERDEKNAEAWAWLGEAKQQQGQDGSAELERALTLGRANPNIHGLRALYWERQGNDEHALAEYLLAAEYDAGNPAWQAGIGSAYVRLGDLIAALEAYQRAVELAPTDAVYWRMLAAVCAENDVYVEEIGLPAAQQAVMLAPDDPLALDTLGFSYFVSGRHANAEQIFSQAIDLAPDYFPAHLHLAMNYLAQNNRAAAFNSLTFVRDADGTGRYREIAVQLIERYFP